MHIVAAAVHLARHLGSKLLAGFLLQGQGVHVAAQQDHFAGLFAARQRQHAAFAAVLRGIAHLSQGFFDKSLGLGQVKADLGVTVQGAPPFTQLGFQLLCRFQQFFRCDHNKTNSLFLLSGKPSRSLPCNAAPSHGRVFEKTLWFLQKPRPSGEVARRQP